MILYIDGDALPNVLKQILFRAIKRLSLKSYVISNTPISLGKSGLITYLVVDAGPDEADDKIVELIQEGDLAITADIPLAARIIEKNAHAIDHRGELFDEDNIKRYIAMRELMQGIRDSGEFIGGPKPFSQKDARNFANQLDRFLTKYTM